MKTRADKIREYRRIELKARKRLRVNSHEYKESRGVPLDEQGRLSTKRGGSFFFVPCYIYTR